MKAFGLLLFSCAIALSHGILSGQNVTVGEMPYAVTFLIYFPGYNKGLITCNGVILNENYVLTTGYCVDSWEDHQFEIIAGTTDYKQRNVVRKIAKRHLHEGYNFDNSHINDIALVKVDRPFEFNENVAPAKLPESDDVYDGKTATIAGWGIANPADLDTSEFLLKNNASVISNEQCNKMLEDIHQHVEETQMCTYDSNLRSGPCNGDAGGPLIINDVVVGLISWMDRGCVFNSDKPVLNTNIYKYLDWIRENSK